MLGTYVVYEPFPRLPSNTVNEGLTLGFLIFSLSLTTHTPLTLAIPISIMYLILDFGYCDYRPQDDIPILKRISLPEPGPTVANRL